MSVKIRLTRMGKKKQPTYRVVVMDSRKPRDGAYLEQIGRYDPRQEPSIVEIDNERALDWLMKGAQPTERARKLLEISGAWMQFRVAKGDVYTVGDTDAAAAPAVASTRNAPTCSARPYAGGSCGRRSAPVGRAGRDRRGVSGRRWSITRGAIRGRGLVAT
jgi:small subunit ribosomal protein S16